MNRLIGLALATVVLSSLLAGCADRRYDRDRYSSRDYPSGTYDRTSPSRTADPTRPSSSVGEGVREGVREGISEVTRP